MGMHGPLTALALGRSPYDDVFQGTGEADPRVVNQQFDARGRPVNPETRRQNRDMIRAHNEVMMVIGVAESDNPAAESEQESVRRHYEDEDRIGSRLTYLAHRCIQAVGVFGVDGARQRILVYKEYSHTSFWDLYASARRSFYAPTMLLAGAPSALAANRFDSVVVSLWLDDPARKTARRIVHEVWSYVRVHLELFAAMQRLGILRRSQLFPTPSFFVPFSESSPIPAPLPLQDLSLGSIATWLGNAFICATPFMLWILTRRLYRDLRPLLWSQILKRLPSTMWTGRKAWLQQHLAPEATVVPAASVEDDGMNDMFDDRLPPEPIAVTLEEEEASPGTGVDTAPSQGTNSDQTTPVEEADVSVQIEEPTSPAPALQDIATDEEDNEVVSATLISFDVEATDTIDAPHGQTQGTWSAELRNTTDGTRAPEHKKVHLDSMLTTLPPMLAADVIGDALLRLFIAPYEAIALRKVAAMFLMRQGLSTAAICTIRPFEGLGMTPFVNFMAIEFLNFSMSGEIWAIITRLAQALHFGEGEWLEDSREMRGTWYYQMFARPE